MNQKNLDVNKELSLFNKITFNEDKHSYSIDNKLSNKFSVTGAINKFKPAFDSDKWANIKAKKEGITAEEMKFIWSEKALYATELGTCVHKLIESIYVDLPHVLPDYNILEEKIGKEKLFSFQKKFNSTIEGFCDFYKRTKHNIIPVRNELVIGDIDNSMVCGMLDMLAFNKESMCYEIYDFKTNNKISYKNNYNERFNTPLEHIQVCEFNTYSLQLSIYRYILEKYTNIKINKSYILWLPGTSGVYELIQTKYFDTEAKCVLDLCKEYNEQNNLLRR